VSTLNPFSVRRTSLFLPDVKLRGRDVVVGAFVTATLFTIGKQLIGFYLGQSITASTYGGGGFVIVLLLWVYYSSQVVLVGAEFTRIYTQRQARRPRPNRLQSRFLTLPPRRRDGNRLGVRFITEGVSSWEYSRARAWPWGE
jgi:uncharacterized BrkB/YihY/UPF0761 family membrane protein